jgi:putative DNA methylase
MEDHKTHPSDPRRWYNSNYLPHFDAGEIPQFVTYRLAGSLPVSIRQFYKQQLAEGRISEIDYHHAIDKYLDEGKGPDHLKRREVASIIEENFLRFDGEKYRLHAWVIMPNHGHVLFTPINGFTLEKIIHSMKSFTANRANAILGRTGPFWAREYYYRYIRSREHFLNTINYIDNNPVKARLCRQASDWPFGSARMTLTR